MVRSLLYLVNSRFMRALSISILVSTCIIVVGSSDLQSEVSEALNAVCKANHNFTISLYQAVSKLEKKNVLISPLSVHLVLALTYTGAKGQTADELTTLLALPNNTQLINTGYNELIKSLENPVLKIANKIFVDTSVSLKDGFQKNAEKYFLSSAKAVDFHSDPENSRDKINRWVQQHTNQKITNLLAPGKITSDTVFVLINAIHFKASWHHRFLKESTKTESFYISKNMTVSIQMMHTKGTFGIIYSDELLATILKLDYIAKDFYMIIALPDESDGLPALESRLDNVNIFNIIKDMEPTTVLVSLPKFNIEETVELNSVLQSLGLQTMFRSQADFGGMTDKPVAVSSVVQKAFIDVSENGTEAAVATAVVSALKSMLITPEFIADHPFMFLVMHKDSPIFIGRFSHP